MEDIKEIIERIYRDFNPEKISNIPVLLEKYQGNEAEILLKLSQKYAFRLENYIPVDYLQLVTAILTKYDPERVSAAANLVDSYQGRENELLTLLGEKYTSGFNDLVIAVYMSGSPAPEPPGNIPPIGAEYIPAAFQASPGRMEPAGEKSSKKRLYGIIAIVSVILVGAVLYVSGVFNSGEKTGSSATTTDTTAVSTGNSNPGEDAAVPQAKATLQAYYADLMNGTFDATRYFADPVERFITMLNTTPQAINSYINSSYYKEFVNGRSEIENGTFILTKDGGDRYSVEYIENGSCFRTSRQKYQHTRAHVKVILNSGFKIVFFQQDKLLQNDFSDTSPEAAAGNISQPETNRTEAQNNSSSFYIISAAAVNTENQAKAKAKELGTNGNAAGYLWIPDYASLSGARLYCVYIGPFSTQNDCEVATENYRKLHPEAYGLLVSQERKRVQINGIGKVVVTRK